MTETEMDYFNQQQQARKKLKDEGEGRILSE